MILLNENRRLMKAFNTIRKAYGEPYTPFKSPIQPMEMIYFLLEVNCQKKKNKIIKELLQNYSDFGYIDKNGRRRKFDTEADANDIFLSCNVKGI